MNNCSGAGLGESAKLKSEKLSIETLCLLFRFYCVFTIPPVVTGLKSD